MSLLFCNDLYEIPQLLFYSHVPILIISIIFGFFIIYSNHSKIENKLFFTITLLLDLLIIFNLIIWTSNDSKIIMSIWSIPVLINFSFPFVTFSFIYKIIYDKSVPRIIFIPACLAIIIYAFYLSSKYYINDFNVNYCEPIEKSFLATIILQASFVFFTILSVYHLIKHSLSRNRSTPIILSGLGAILFIINLFLIFQFAFISSNYDLELYAFLGLPVFIGLLSYSIVRFKAFDIKLLAAQALVWALIIFIGSEFFFVKDLTTQLLVGVTLVISTVLGLILVRSVKKEVALRESLEIANRNQESLIHFVSHQLKGFFTKSKMIFSGLLEGDFGLVPEAVQDVAKVGLTSDNNAVAMIQNILGASNLKTGITDYHLKSIALNDVVKKVCGLFTEEMSKKGLIFETDITEKVLLVSVDETQIIQVFKNLIDNSLNYTPAGKIKVILKTSLDNKKVLFEVSDTGVGLSDEDKSRLFTEGGKGAESIKVNVNSTGYGLYIVKKIVESHKGRVWAESAGRGHGSQFYVELKLVE
jgi:signal transduction histidine kinase